LEARAVADPLPPAISSSSRRACTTDHCRHGPHRRQHGDFTSQSWPPTTAVGGSWSGGARGWPKRWRRGELDPGRDDEAAFRRPAADVGSVESGSADPHAVVNNRIKQFLLWQLAYANPQHRWCSGPRFQRAEPGARPCSDFQNRQRRFGGVNSHGPAPVSPLPFHVRLDRPSAPLTAPLSAPLTAIPDLPFPLRHTGARQEIEDLRSNPAGVLPLVKASRCTRAANPWLSGSKLWLPVSVKKPAAWPKKTAPTAPNPMHHSAESSGRPGWRGAGAGAGRAPRPQAPSAFLHGLGLGATFAMVAPFDRHLAHGAGVRALGWRLASTGRPAHRPSRPNGWLPPASPPISHNSTPSPGVLRPDTTHAPPIRAPETLARVRRAGLNTSAAAASSAWGGERTPTRAGLLQVLANLDPHPRERADQLPWWR